MLGLKPDVATPSAPTLAPTSAPTSAPQSAHGEGGSGGGQVFSRLLEHTASSLARCAATLPHVPTQSHAHLPAAAASAAAAAPAPAATARAFGSPLLPRSRGGSANHERDASTTPVGAEGATPDGSAPEVQQHGDHGAASPDAGSRARGLQLQELHRNLSALQEQGAVTLGLNPSAIRPATAEQQQRSASPPRAVVEQQQHGSGKPGSPFRRYPTLVGWGRDSATPPSDAAAPQPSSPGRLARFFGRGSGGSSGGKAPLPAAKPGTEATYDLQQPLPRQDKAAGQMAGHPLRCSNGHSTSTSEASGSRAGSPRDPDFRIGATSCAAGAPENRSRPASSAASPTKQPAGGRPRSGGSGGAGPVSSAAAAAAPLRPHTSPRRAPAWKPL